jgi:hypothetical protein
MPSGDWGCDESSLFWCLIAGIKGLLPNSPPQRGGVDARSKKHREATLFRADGVVSSAKVYRPEDFAGLTTPSAAFRWLRTFLLMPQPPLLYQEGSCQPPIPLGNSPVKPATARYSNNCASSKLLTLESSDGSHTKK